MSLDIESERERNRDTPRNRHIFGPGPKRILSIDGGGVRGVISLTFLAEIEKILRRRSNNPNLVLSDYFDLIGGTSTGAIIATGLALGYTVGHMINLYRTLSDKGFQKTGIFSFGGILAPKFRQEALTEVIAENIHDETLGSEQLRTGLAIVAKRLDTESVWVFHNNPLGKYYGLHEPPGSKHIANKDMPLLNLIRASTAAPTFFEPQFIEVARDGDKVFRGAFVDGGASPHNNPALLMFMLATVRGYEFNWPTGADKLLLVSIGNGAAGEPPTDDQISQMTPGMLAYKSVLSIVRDSSSFHQSLLQWMARCPNPWEIDTEIGDLSLDQLGREPLMHYMRYDAILRGKWLAEKLNISYPPDMLDAIRKFDRPDLADEWIRIGQAAADVQIDEKHFPRAFDLPVLPAAPEEPAKVAATA
jgi:hypothetical protein